jgi:hypothetical protein
MSLYGRRAVPFYSIIIIIIIITDNHKADLINFDLLL